MTDKWHRRAGCGAGCVKIKVLMAIVTQVKQNAKNKNKVSVYADGEFLCSVTAESAVKLGVKAGAEIDGARLGLLLEEHDRETAFSKAVECVCRSMKSRSQVEKYLRDKGFSDEIIAQTVSKMTEYRYIDDAEYVRAYVSAYGGKKGARRIKYELSQNGIGRELIDAVDDMLGGQEETAAELARKFMKNRARGRDGAKKLFAHLAAKGFEYSVCADCASRYLDEEDFEV